MSGSATKYPLQKSLSRRVSFNEASLRRRRHDSDTEAQPDGPQGRPIYSNLCFWISLILGLLIFVLIITGSMYFAFLRSNLPDVRLQRFDVFRIDVVSAPNADTLLTADIVIVLNATNGNGKAQLVYSSMTATMSSAGIDFGRIKMEDVIEPPLSSALLTVPASVSNMKVEDAAANELQFSGKKRTLVVDLHVKGKIGVYVGGNRIIGFPFKIECGKLDQKEIEDDRPPKCNSQLTTPLR